MKWAGRGGGLEAGKEAEVTLFLCEQGPGEICGMEADGVQALEMAPL